jgi:hypothetical protein
MTITTTLKEQNFNKQHFFSWDGVKAEYPIDDLCLCGKRQDARKSKNYPLHFPETTPYTYREKSTIKTIDWVEEAKKSWKLGYKDGYRQAIHDLIIKREDIDKCWTRYGGGRTYGEFVRDYLEQHKGL